MSSLLKTTGGLVLASTLALGSATASADHYPPQPVQVPVLSSIGLVHEHLGRHHTIGNELITLNTAGTGANDHMSFEVRGYDQWGRPISSCGFQPVLLFPGSTTLGWIEPLGDNHFRFHAGSFEVSNASILIQAWQNPALHACLMVTMVDGRRAQARHPHDSGYVSRWRAPEPTCNMAPAPVYVAPSVGPGYVAPGTVVIAPAPSRSSWYSGGRRHHSRRDGFSFGLDSDGNFSFGVNFR